MLETGFPNGWTIDIQMADELDELLMDELYDLREVMTANLEKEEKDRRWVGQYDSEVVWRISC